MRKRRTQAEMETLRAGLRALAERHQPCTVRQVYYLAVSAGLVPRTEQGYGVVQRLLADERIAGRIPWGCIVDHTRRVRRPYTYRGLVDAVEDTKRTYRRALWRDQPERVEIWVEKDTLVGPLWPVSDAWDVPLFSCKGYPSVSFLHDAAEDIADAAEYGKRTHILYVGDLDPSGQDIERVVVEGLRRWAPGAEIEAERLAVRPDQIDTLSLPTRPTKRTDSRSRGFKGESVEADAIEPALLRSMVQAAVKALVDPTAMRAVKVAEEDERKLLGGIASLLTGYNGDWLRGLARDEVDRFIGPAQ